MIVVGTPFVAASGPVVVPRARTFEPQQPGVQGQVVIPHRSVAPGATLFNTHTMGPVTIQVTFG